MGFSNPLVGGGGALVYPSIHSPDYQAGTSGWTINKDGSAEFSDLIIRGTFDGTDFEINTDGAFFYDGTPGAGSLAFSIAPASGTDRFGNVYFSGICSYERTGGLIFARLSAGVLQLGQSTDSFAGTLNAQNGIANLASGREASADLATALSLIAGTSSLGGFAMLSTLALGLYQQPDTPSSGSPGGWNDLALASGWSTGPAGLAARYRLIPSPPNEVEFIGQIQSSSAVSGNVSPFTTTLAAAYRPAHDQHEWVMPSASGSSSSFPRPNMHVAASGAISIEALPTGTTIVQFHCFVSLDA